MLNEVTLIGRLGQTPEVKTIPSGTVTNISVATNRDWKDKNTNEWNTETEWHNVVLYGKASMVDKFKKGSLVYVKGRIKTSKWKDANDVLHKYVDIIAEDIKVLDNKAKLTDSLPTYTNKTVEYVYDDPQDDVPF
jgi:single-strand DNA-binding protein